MAEWVTKRIVQNTLRKGRRAENGCACTRKKGLGVTNWWVQIVCTLRMKHTSYTS